MALFSDVTFPCSMTLASAEWRAIVAALRRQGQQTLADKVEAAIGARPE